MNHPQHEEWVPLLFGEADGETTKRLEAHLHACPQCARQIEDWRRSLRRLDSWVLSDQPRKRALHWQPFTWAAAAVILVAFMVGHFTARASDARFKAALRAEITQQLETRFTRAASDSATAFADMEARLLAASSRGNKEMATEFAQALANVRAEDRRAINALFERVQEQHATDFVLLRRDLENLASATDDELQSARMKLFQVATATEKNQ